MKHRLLAASGVAALLVAGVAATFVGGTAAVTSGLLRPHDRALVAEGARLYAAECAACHGASLEGQPDWQTAGPDGLLPAPPHDETGHTWHHPDALLVDITRRGTAAVVGRGYQSAMPGFEGVLADDEIIAVLSFIKSTWPPRIRAAHDEINGGH